MHMMLVSTDLREIYLISAEWRSHLRVLGNAFTNLDQCRVNFGVNHRGRQSPGGGTREWLRQFAISSDKHNGKAVRRHGGIYG